MFKHFNRFIIIIIPLLVCGVNAKAQSGSNENARFSASEVMYVECPEDTPSYYEIECGIVDVPRDHFNPNESFLKLAFAVVHAARPEPGLAPILFIDGGPGARSLDGMGDWIEMIHPILARRDVIFFDQRGAGYSTPALECPEIDLEIHDPVDAFSDLEALISCRDRLVRERIHLDMYNSAQIAADINYLRTALGYQSWHIYGVSYGSRIALTVMRDFPEMVESAILDAITPVEANLLLEDPYYAQEALNRMFAACQADFICRLSYPDLESVYVQAVGDLARQPVSLEIWNSKTRERKTEVLDGAKFNGILLGGLMVPSINGLPGLIYEVGDQNFQPIIDSMEYAWREPDLSAKQKRLLPPLGQQITIMCNDEAPFMSPVAFESMLKKFPADRHYLSRFDQRMYTICRSWGIGSVDPKENTPVNSDIPVLVLVGEFDTARTPDIARQAAQALSNSRVVDFSGAGHSVLYSANHCAIEVMQNFLDVTGSNPEMDCLDNPTGPQFFMTIGTTRPISRVVAAILGLVGWIILIRSAIEVMISVKRGQFAWLVAMRTVGWPLWIISFCLPLLIFLLMPIIDLTYFYEQSLAQAIVMVIPLVAAVQVSGIFPFDLMPSLEILLACSHPFKSLLTERIWMAIVGQSIAAFLLTAIALLGLGEIFSLTIILGWLASILLLCGLAINISVRSRQPNLGVLVALLVWLVFGIASSNIADGLIPAIPLSSWNIPWPRPLGLVQPFIWMFHPFLRPDHLTPVDFLINRVIVGSLGIILIAWSLSQLKDTEFVLLGTKTRKVRR